MFETLVTVVATGLYLQLANTKQHWTLRLVKAIAVGCFAQAVAILL